MLPTLTLRSLRWMALACAVGVLAIARPAAAHPLDIGYLRIAADGTEIDIALDMHVNAAARLIGHDGAMTASDVRRAAEALAGATYRSGPLATAAGACRWTAASAVLTGQTASLAGRAACPSPARTLRWELPFVRDARVSPTFQILVKAVIDGEDEVAIVDRAQPVLAITRSGAVGFGAFVWTGVEHIGAAPGQWHDATGWKLPDGIDHILFLLALMLAGGTLVQLLGVVSGFTLGHSITLALSALHVVRPPPSVIEPLIALTIAAVAGKALIGRFERHRWTIATCFGLVHGFGFASALNELELSTGNLVSALLGYNLGVELGQVAIVLATAPLLLVVQRNPRLHPLVRVLAAAILIAGVYWFFQRM